MDRIDAKFYYDMNGLEMMPVEIKREFRAMFKAGRDGELVSLMDAPRTFYYDDGERYTEYGIYDPDGMSDAEIEEQLSVEYDSCQIYSPYDCTGKRFMSSYHWSRLHNGCISVIKRFALDV